MNDDYLWDRTGEPDPEIQQLEEVLGTLRYQPEPLVTPAQLQLAHRRRPISHFAIAAAITVMVFGACWWVLLTTRQATQLVTTRQIPEKSTTTEPVPVKAIESNDPAVRSIADNKNSQPRPHQARQTMLARSAARRHTQVTKSEAIAKDRTEAEAAKQQLLLALRVASAKLSLAQKRTQGTYPANMIRNQHKVG